MYYNNTLSKQKQTQMIGLNIVLYFDYRDRWVYVEYIEESWHSVEMLREINFGKIRTLNNKFKKPWRIEGYTVWILNNFLQSNFSSIEKIESQICGLSQLT